MKNIISNPTNIARSGFLKKIKKTLDRYNAVRHIALMTHCVMPIRNSIRTKRNLDNPNRLVKKILIKIKK